MADTSLLIIDMQVGNFSESNPICNGARAHKLKKDLLNMASQFVEIKASVENIPTHWKGHTPFSLVKQFDYVTLDTKWASLYNELDSFESIINKIVNIHLRGSLRECRWVLNSSNFDFYEALDLIRDR